MLSVIQGQPISAFDQANMPQVLLMFMHWILIGYLKMLLTISYSSYYHVIPSRFLPPPIPLIQVKGVLKVPEPNMVDAIAKFYVTFCFDLIAMEKLLPQNARVFPNDLYCQPLLSSRMCSECGLYFATLKN